MGRLTPRFSAEAGRTYTMPVRTRSQTARNPASIVDLPDEAIESIIQQYIEDPELFDVATEPQPYDPPVRFRIGSIQTNPNGGGFVYMAMESLSEDEHASDDEPEPRYSDDEEVRHMLSSNCPDCVPDAESSSDERVRQLLFCNCSDAESSSSEEPPVRRVPHLPSRRANP